MMTLPMRRTPVVFAAAGEDKLQRLAKKHPVIDLFLRLAEIPSPTQMPGSPHAPAIAARMEAAYSRYQKAFEALGISNLQVLKDPTGSMVLRIPGSPGYTQHRPLLLMGHMDIVPADIVDPLRAIYPRLKRGRIDGKQREVIATDGTTTLGADNKACLAAMWDAVRRIVNSGKPHVPVEILVVPDEEGDTASMEQIDTRQFNAKHVVVVDETRGHIITTGCAGFVDVQIRIKGLKGGHSGMHDDKDTISAADFLTELQRKLGNRIQSYRRDFCDVPRLSRNVYASSVAKAPSNALPVEAMLSMSVRAADAKTQAREIRRIKGVVDAMVAKYRPMEPGLSVSLTQLEELPPWHDDPKGQFSQLTLKAGKAAGAKQISMTASHGACQANPLAKKVNRQGEPFEITIIGADIRGEHSVHERVDWRSIIDLSAWLEHLILGYTDHPMAKPGKGRPKR
jgi:acetylornithine deacetylase/succinyl-diaminopimelate desuccinylase-like protein